MLGRLLRIAAGVAVWLALAAPADAHPSAQLVVSQVYGGGGNTSASYQNDFIEIFNRQGAPADLTGYSVQYAASTGSVWSVTPLSGTLQIGQYLLIAEGGGGVVGSPLPSADATGNTDLSATSGKVALVASFTPLTSACPSSIQMVDLVGYGTAANCSEGAPTPNITNNVNSATRKLAGCTDTNNNSNDFSITAANPRNTLTTRNLCSPVPSAPTVSSTSPSSPGNSLTPKVIGSAGAGTTVELYTNANCSGSPTATDTAAQFSSPGIPVTVSANSTTTFYALSFDSNNTSTCSTSSATYVQDSAPPSAPTLITSSPASPANDISPKILGSAEAGSIVKLYSDAACSTPVGSGTAAQFASPGISASADPNATTTFRATATDNAGNTSGCSSSSLTYVEDSSLPAAPTLSASVPASPSASTSPVIKGSAETGSTVRLYSDASCTASAASGTAAQLGSSGISVSVAPNSTTTFFATATNAVGNVSPCSSSSVTYVNDSDGPTAPSFSSSVPASPANDTSPKILGSAEAGSTVKLYTDAACTNLATSGAAAQFTTPGLTVTVSPNSTTSFHATATDAAGNTSICSSASLTYVEASRAPAQPVFSSSDPASPANDTSPMILGTADTGSTVSLYTDSACTMLAATDSAAQFGSPGIQVSVAADSTTTFHATATDAVGNTSACSSSSLTYVQDSGSPSPPTLSATDPASPANDTSPKILGSAEPGSTVKLYRDASCTILAATGTAAELASPGIAASVSPNSTTTFHATATTAGKTSGCSPTFVTFEEDSAQPAPPVFHASDPASPSPSSSPRLLGSADSGTTVRVYDDVSCSSLVATASASDFTSPGILVTVGPDSTTTFHGTATDRAGNTSDCSSSQLTYTQVGAGAPSVQDARTPAAQDIPLISGLRLAPRKFAIGLTRTPVAVSATEGATAQGTMIHFVLSQQARVSFTVLRRPLRPQAPSTQGSPVKRFGRLLPTGEQAVPFSGRLGNRIFRPGNYRLVASAASPDGQASGQSSAPFKIVRR